MQEWLVEEEFKIRALLLISPNSLTQGDWEAICRQIHILPLLWLLVNEARQFIVAPPGVKNIMCKTHTKKKSFFTFINTQHIEAVHFCSNEGGDLKCKAFHRVEKPSSGH